MRFSNKAYKYLEKLKRDQAFVFTDRNAIRAYLKKQGVSVFEKLVDFQTEFSGLELTIINSPTNTFSAQLFSADDILANRPATFDLIENQYYFDCGDHATAQFWFVINEKGEIGTYDNRDSSVNVIFSSFDKFIETYAFRDLLSGNGKYDNRAHYDLVDIQQFSLLTHGYKEHLTASDNYHKWLSNDSGLIIEIGTWYDRASFFVHLYGNCKEDCEAFAHLMKERGIIS